MTTEKAYEQFIIKINKNAQTDAVHCDRGRFVVLYNEAQIKHLEYLLDRRNEDEIRYAENFVVPNSPLELTEESDYTTGTLPDNYLDFISLIAKATTEYCSNAKINMFETKLEDIDIILSDEFNKPSFDYREAPFKIGNNKVIAYKEDFTYDELLLTYYRYPTEIKLINPEDPESQFDEDVNPEWDDKSNNRILDACAARFLLNNDDPKYQANKMESIQKK
jgi:hypothetical protein